MKTNLIFAITIIISFQCTGLYNNRLSDAIILNDSTTIIKLIRKGINVNAFGRFGNTPLTCAVGSNNYSIVKLLLEKGADPNIKDKSSQTAIMYLAQKNTPIDTILNLLLKSGADINATNRGGTSALQIALYMNNINAAKSLIKYGANNHLSNETGNSILTCATRNCDYAIVKLMLDKTVKFKIENINEIVNIARENHCTDSLKMYLEEISKTYLEKN